MRHPNQQKDTTDSNSKKPYSPEMVQKICQLATKGISEAQYTVGYKLLHKAPEFTTAMIDQNPWVWLNLAASQGNEKAKHALIHLQPERHLQASNPEKTSTMMGDAMTVGETHIITRTAQGRYDVKRGRSQRTINSSSDYPISQAEGRIFSPQIIKTSARAAVPIDNIATHLGSHPWNYCYPIYLMQLHAYRERQFAKFVAENPELASYVPLSRRTHYIQLHQYCSRRQPRPRLQTTPNESTYRASQNPLSRLQAKKWDEKTTIAEQEASESDNQTPNLTRKIIRAAGGHSSPHINNANQKRKYVQSNPPESEKRQKMSVEEAGLALLALRDASFFPTNA
jgi:hypothetical protein